MYKNLALSENGFLFDARTGNTFSLNRTGTFLLRALIDGVPVEHLTNMLQDTFEVSVETAIRDVEQFLYRIKDLEIAHDEEDY